MSQNNALLSSKTQKIDSKNDLDTNPKHTTKNRKLKCHIKKINSKECFETKTREAISKICQDVPMKTGERSERVKQLITSSMLS